MKSSKDVLELLSRLMDEDVGEISSREDKYNKLYDYVHDKLVKALDQGAYIANSEIIRKLDELLEGYSVYNLINKIVGKELLVFRGAPYHLQKRVFEPILGRCNWIRNNSNLPMFIINGDANRDIIYAVTYMNKIIEIDKEDYVCITRELYKNNLEIRKLLKCFFVFSNHDFENITFLVMPEYVDENNSIYESLKRLITDEYLFVDSDGVWEKIKKRSSFRQLSYIGEGNLAADRLYIDKDDVIISDIIGLLNKKNRPRINFNIESELLDILLDAEVYYENQIGRVVANIEMLSKDSVMLEDGMIKSQVNTYKRKLFTQKESLELGKKQFMTMRDEVLGLAKEYETELSDALLHDVDGIADASAYINTLLSIFFKYVSSRQIEGIKKCIFKLRRAKYKYPEACDMVLKCVQGTDITPSEINRLKKFPDSNWEIAKIKVMLSKQLKLKYDDIKEIIRNIDGHYDSGKEYYFLGKKKLDEKNIIEAKQDFEIALDYDYMKAGTELIKMAEKYPECEIDIGELAENLVPEANYNVGCNSLYSENKYRKGIVNIKMAASKEYLDAVILIADFLFGECKEITWQEMKNPENVTKVNNVIRLYEYLERKNVSSEGANSERVYLLRVGLMYCKLAEYARAYNYLKNLDMPEAQYECARMCQYGDGVAKDLNKAKKHYQNIKGVYKDSDVQLAKINSQLQKVSQSNQKSYSQTKSYQSSSYTTSSSSSYCFITTAACLALQASKDCNELNRLRKFRDEYILNEGNDGENLVAEYYRIGPMIVNYIDSEWNPFSIYKELWEEYILVSCEYIEKEMWEKARQVYISMVKKLCEKYSVPVMNSIMEKYEIKVKLSDG